MCGVEDEGFTRGSGKLGVFDFAEQRGGGRGSIGGGKPRVEVGKDMSVGQRHFDWARGNE